MLDEDDLTTEPGVIDLAMRGWRTLDEHPLDTQAKRVQLEHNNLSALPRAIGSLTFMLKLDVCAAARRGNKTAALLERHSSRSHNMLETLPKAIGKCTRLRVLYVDHRAAQESDIPNFKGSYLGRFPLVSADFWTSDHRLERSRSVDAFHGTRARGILTLKRR